MGRIKEFYHDEICASQEDALLDAECQEFIHEEEEAVEAAIADFEAEGQAVADSGMPAFLHSRF